MKGRFPKEWERSLLKMPKVAKRHHPIRMPHETQFQYSLTVKAADGKSVNVVGPKALARDTDYVSFEKGVNAGAQSSIKWTTFALYADPSEYNKIREEWDYLLSETSPMVIVK